MTRYEDRENDWDRMERFDFVPLGLKTCATAGVILLFYAGQGARNFFRNEGSREGHFLALLLFIIGPILTLHFAFIYGDILAYLFGLDSMDTRGVLAVLFLYSAFLFLLVGFFRKVR